ncbi:MAG: cytochrome b/b6 domain-containing protein [Deltaproteobacteria bacterium]|nr:cytochrome b/b6 domain-containing protein [Deltaproteobacteria bacterium]
MGVRRAQPWPIRVAHLVNIVAFVMMMTSGLQILRAYPYFGPQGETWTWVPLQGWDSPEWLRSGGWLAGARHLHFAWMWVFMANGAFYVGYLVKSGELRRRMFWPPRDTRPAVRQLLRYLKIRKDSEPVNLYNGLQRAAYTGAIALGLLEVLSGLAIWKPVTLHRICWLMGGYDSARVIHFLALLGLMLFVVVHVVLVAVHWRQAPHIVTGGPKETTKETKETTKETMNETPQEETKP